jgi:uncharacterized membrane protein
MDTLSLIITVGSLIVGLMLLTGHGEIFMKSSNASETQKLYDEKKMEKVYGVGMLLIGVVSGIDCFTTSLAAKIIYVVVLIIIFVAMITVVKTKCKR